MRNLLRTLFFTLLCILSVTIIVSGTGDAKVLVNGKYIEMDQKPIFKDDRILIPVRAVGEALKCRVDWNHDTQTVTLNNGATELKIVIGEAEMKKINVSRNPIEIPIYVDDIRATFSSENTMTKSDNRIAFAFKKDNKVNIVYSIDNGQSWETSYIDKNYDVYYFKNINKNVSYLVLISNAAMRDIETYIYKSSDGFKTWQEVSKQNMKIDSKVNFESENIGYFVIASVDNTNNEYFATTDGGKTFNKIISETKAADIADKEAKKDKYQYQSWKSNFQSRWEGKASNEIASKLLYEMDDITRLYHWNEEWKISDYKNKLMWEIWLNDENDPLTNLYIYIDAYNGNIIGAGKASD